MALGTEHTGWGALRPGPETDRLRQEIQTEAALRAAREHLRAMVAGADAVRLAMSQRELLPAERDALAALHMARSAAAPYAREEAL
jgi:hypothetical protein